MPRVRMWWVLLTVITMMPGCIRLTGSAGYWKQGGEDTAPVIHQAGFDTAQLVPAKPRS